MYVCKHIFDYFNILSLSERQFEKIRCNYKFIVTLSNLIKKFRNVYFYILDTI